MHFSLFSSFVFPFSVVSTPVLGLTDLRSGWGVCVFLSFLRGHFPDMLKVNMLLVLFEDKKVLYEETVYWLSILICITSTNKIRVSESIRIKNKSIKIVSYTRFTSRE